MINQTNQNPVHTALQKSTRLRLSNITHTLNWILETAKNVAAFNVITQFFMIVRASTDQEEIER